MVWLLKERFHSMKANYLFMLENNNPGYQVGVSTKLCSMGLIFVGPQCGIFSCPLLAPRILNYLPHFWKNFPSCFTVSI